MDLEQLKKINTLSHELRRHGFSSSSEDAYREAERTIQIIPKQHVQPVQESAVIEVPSSASALAERQFQLQVEQLTKQFSAELDAFREAVNDIIKEVNALHEDVSRLRAEASQPRKKEKQIHIAPEQKTLPDEKKEAHPRQGAFTPGDVDIQKMFYFGKK